MLLNIYALRRIGRTLGPKMRPDVAVMGAPSRTWAEFLDAVDALNELAAALEEAVSPLGTLARALWAKRDYLSR